MDYDKNTIIAFVLIFLILIGYWMYNAPKVQNMNEIQETQHIDEETVVQDSTKRVQTNDESVQSETEKQHIESTLMNSNDSPFMVEQSIENTHYVIDTENFRAIINSKGAVVRSWRLKKYAKPNTTNGKKIISENNWVEVIAPNGDFEDFFYPGSQKNFDEYNFNNLSIFLPTKTNVYETGELNFSCNTKSDTLFLSNSNPMDSLVFTLNLTNGGKIQKKYIFYSNKYDFNLELKLQDVNEILSQPYYKIEWKSGLSPTESYIKDDMNYAKGYISSGKDINKIDVRDEDEEPSVVTGSNINWIGTTTKYFGTCISPLFTEKEDYSLLDAEVDGRDIIIDPQKEYNWRKFEIGLKIPMYSNYDEVTHNYQVYIGPLDYFLLKKYNRNYEGMVDLGMKYLRPISKLILLAFINLHKFISNYGFVIIIFSILIKIILYPLTKKSYSSMKKMQELQPELNELKEKHKDPRKLQEAQMRLYKEKGVNPAGGCLPMLLQMPLLFALYWVFRNTIELRGEPFIWWITDLSMPDTVLTLPFSIPLYGDQFNILPLLMGASMLIQQKMTVKDPKQKAMVYIMPVFMVLIFNKLSSGLNLYYTLFNLFSMIQQKFGHTDDKKNDENEQIKTKKIATKSPRELNKGKASPGGKKKRK